VRFRDTVGKIRCAANPDSFCILDFRSGQNRKLKIAVVRQLLRRS
jgi:hypothetical protein